MRGDYLPDCRESLLGVSRRPIRYEELEIFPRAEFEINTPTLEDAGFLECDGGDFALVNIEFFCGLCQFFEGLLLSVKKCIHFRCKCA